MTRQGVLKSVLLTLCGVIYLLAAPLAVLKLAADAAPVDAAIEKYQRLSQIAFDGDTAPMTVWSRETIYLQAADAQYLAAEAASRYPGLIVLACEPPTPCPCARTDRCTTPDGGEAEHLSLDVSMPLWRTAIVSKGGRYGYQRMVLVKFGADSKVLSKQVVVM